MKKRILSLSIAAMIGGVGLAGGASAAVFTDTSANAATGMATAVSTNGVGNILLVPYFTTQGGNATLLNIVNTDTVNGKAVKVRFRGASNSDDIYDFQVLMSPGDVWAASVSQDAATGISTLATSDATCTLPATVNGLFNTLRVQSSASQTREGYIEILNMADIPKAGSVDQGTIVNGAYTATTTNPLYTAIKHTNGVATCSNNAAGLAAINLLAQDPTNFAVFTSAPTAAAFTASTGTNSPSISATGMGLTFPTGGLFADWTIINVANTTTFTGQATAVATAGTAAAGAVGPNANLVFFPQIPTAIPTATNGATYTGSNGAAANGAGINLDNVTADPILRKTGLAYSVGTVLGSTNPNATVGYNTVANNITTVAAGSTAAVMANPVVTALYFDQPDLSTPYTGAVDATATAKSPLDQALALTAPLVRTAVTNEYLTTPVLAAATDWVFSMPTRRYYTAYAYGYAGATGTGQIYTDYKNSTSQPGKFFAYFGPNNTTSSAANAQICTKLTPGATAFGRDEQVIASAPPVFQTSPGSATPSTTLSLCGETTVLSFGVASAVLSGSVANTTYPAAGLPSVDGWATFSTLAKGDGTTGTNLAGLPILGFSAEKAVNGAVKAGVSGNFGLLYSHR